jgi:glutamate-1-semialdehyde 2,1-aminomutase
MKIKDISQTFALQERAKARIPGLSQLLSKRPDRFSYGVWPGYFSRAEGARVWDMDGNEYVDMSIGGIGATVLGYQDPDVDAAVHEAISRGVASSLNCPEEVELADLLCELHPWADMVRFGRSGGEALAIAVRIARAATGRDKVAFCGYHGWHDWYLAANLGTENALGEHLISGLDPAGVPKALAGTALPFSYNDADSLASIVNNHGHELAAVIMEPIRSSLPEAGFLNRVCQLTESCGAVLIADEVSAGFRLTCGGAHMVLGFEPDLAVFSKALGNGYPVSAVIGRAGVMEAAQKSFISSTNWTDRIGSVAALAMIRKFRREKAHIQLIASGESIQRGWQQLGQRHGIGVNVGGIAPLSHFAFELPNPLEAKAYYVQLMLDQGFLASTIFYSMYAHTNANVEAYLVAADLAFSEIARAAKAEGISERLRGEPSASGFKRLA